KCVAALRSLGIALALDDFGDGHSSLRLWAELAPEFVKIDKYFVRGLQEDATRFQCVKAMQHLSKVFGTRLVAEGVECEADLRVLRDLGIEFGQGYLLGMPEADPPHAPPPQIISALASGALSVYPEVVRMPQRQNTVSQLVISAPTLGQDETNNFAVDLFASHTYLHAIAVLGPEGAPIGILNRRAFMDRYAQPYYRELYGKRPCTAFMNADPLVVERNFSIEALTQVLTGQDQRYLADGLVIADSGRYVGLATGESLVRAVAEIRVEAARYANPLTFLPGNIPISEHIARLLGAGVEFTACYSDLNQFKPFNDQYGYWRGDEMIKLAAACLSAACDPLRDFLGHVGGDDFVVLFQSADWRDRCVRIVSEFNTAAPSLFDTVDRERGGITAEDRQGRPAFFPLTTLSLGVVRILAGSYQRPEDVASAAAMAKREAKHRGLAIFELDDDPAALARRA
ncbi:MAG: phosphodiesterase, partial [Usitatibacter sp.]